MKIKIDGPRNDILEGALNQINPEATIEYGGIYACETCNHFACICMIEAAHIADCKFRRAACCSVGIECDHGFDVCPECDPCTCSLG